MIRSVIRQKNRIKLLQRFNFSSFISPSPRAMHESRRSDLASGARYSLRQLEAFRAVAALGSAARAAHELGRTPSAISMALRELQSALGVALLQRSGRGLVLTTAGERLLPRADELLLRAGDLAQALGDARLPAVPLSIGASRTIGATLMPELITAFRQRHGIERIRLWIGNTEEVLSRVASFELEVAFVEGEVTDPGLEREVWTRDALVIFVRYAHPLLRDRVPVPASATAATRPRVSPAELIAWPWALREQQSGTREAALRAAASIGRIRIGVEATDNETLKRLVLLDDWIGCLSRRVVAEELARGTLVELEVTSPAVRRALGRDFLMVTDPQRYRGAAVARFLEFARAWSGRRAATSTRPG